MATARDSIENLEFENLKVRSSSQKQQVIHNKQSSTSSLRDLDPTDKRRRGSSSDYQEEKRFRASINGSSEEDFVGFNRDDVLAANKNLARVNSRLHQPTNTKSESDLVQARITQKTRSTNKLTEGYKDVILEVDSRETRLANSTVTTDGCATTSKQKQTQKPKSIEKYKLKMSQRNLAQK